jgi:hypothetical protein
MGFDLVAKWVGALQRIGERADALPLGQPSCGDIFPGVTECAGDNVQSLWHGSPLLRTYSKIIEEPHFEYVGLRTLRVCCATAHI